MSDLKFKAATVLAASSHRSKEETIQKVLSMTEQAAERGAELIVFS